MTNLELSYEENFLFLFTTFYLCKLFLTKFQFLSKLLLFIFLLNPELYKTLIEYYYIPIYDGMLESINEIEKSLNNFCSVH